MAAIVATRHVDFWPQRTDHSIQYSDLHFTGMMPSYSAQRHVTNAPSPRTYQATTSQIDMPLFASNIHATSVPYQSGAYAFNHIPANSYNMQPNFPMHYPTNMPPAVSYTSSLDPQSLPNAGEAHNTFATIGTPLVKSESNSPAQMSPVFNEISYTTCKRSGSEPTENAEVNFATEVDTLMKAIQAKQTTSPQEIETPKVSLGRETCIWSILMQVKKEEPKASPKPRKRYQCHMPSCNKSFYQKTHLEIHIRAHTGAKPFVSNMLL